MPRVVTYSTCHAIDIKKQKQKSIDSPVEHVQISKILNSEEEHLKIPRS